MSGKVNDIRQLTIKNRLQLIEVGDLQQLRVGDGFTALHLSQYGTHIVAGESTGLPIDTSPVTMRAFSWPRVGHGAAPCLTLSIGFCGSAK